MTSKNILVAMTLLVVLLLAVFALRQQSARASVSEISNNWYNSPHADRTAEAFIHWDVEDPPSVPVRCAMCHSYYGFADFLGVDGSAPGTVDVEAKVGSVLFCTTCHNPAAPTYTAVDFPSGTKLEGLGPEAMCMTCHHGRESTVGINRATAGEPADTPIEEQGFINPHYFVASATQAGGDAHGAYEYDGRTYVGRFEHTKTMRTCHACHDPHSLVIDPKSCSPCHANVVDEEDLRDIRQSTPDYDGDGNAREGIASELETLHDLLYQILREYAARVLGAPIAYNDLAYPYFFVDTNNDGKTDEQEATFVNRYVLWSPRLLHAAYNYQFVEKDPGGFVHNPKYLLQVMYDSVEDLRQQVTVPMAGMVRP
jgi:hypothetical protein